MFVLLRTRFATNTFVFVFVSVCVFLSLCCNACPCSVELTESHDYIRPLKATHRNSFNANTLFDKMFSLDFAM